MTKLCYYLLIRHYMIMNLIQIVLITIANLSIMSSFFSPLIWLNSKRAHKLNCNSFVTIQKLYSYNIASSKI